MIVRQLFVWMQSATAVEVADVVRDLAESYLCGELSHEDSIAAEKAFITLLDNESPLIRTALAETFSRSENAPYSIIAGLSQDIPEIASLVLTHSPLFIESELVQMAKTLPAPQQLALLAREDVSPALALALANYGNTEVVEHLLDLQELDQHTDIIEVILKRFGHDAVLRNKLNTLYNLSPINKFTIIQLQNTDFHALSLQNGWLTEERAKNFIKDTTDKAALSMALKLADEPLTDYVAALFTKNIMTTSLLLRAIFSGHKRFFERALAHLANLELKRVIGLTRDTQGKGLKALLTAANIPSEVHGTFEACLDVRKDTLSFSPQEEKFEMSRDFISEVVLRVRGTCHISVLLLLRRFEAEAAKEEAHLFKAAILQPENVQEAILDETIGWDYGVEINKNEEELVMDLTHEASAIELFKREIEAKKKSVDLNPAVMVHVETSPAATLPMNELRIPQTTAKTFPQTSNSRVEFEAMMRKLESEVENFGYKKAA